VSTVWFRGCGAELWVGGRSCWWTAMDGFAVLGVGVCLSWVGDAFCCWMCGILSFCIWSFEF